MALQKQSINVNVSQGLDTKSDPFQVPLGRFLALQNSVFTKAGLLQKRNGFGNLASLPDTSNIYLTTFNNNLTAIGTSINAYSSGSETWVSKGNYPSIDLETLSLIRSSTNQSYADCAVASNGLVCTVFTDSVPVAGVATNFYKYAVADSVTGQNVVAPTIFSSSGAPKVYALGRYFVVVYPSTTHLKYFAISISNPATVTAAVDLSTQLSYSSTGNFDGIVANNTLYVAFNGSDGGGAVRITALDSILTQHGTTVFAGRVSTIMTVTADTTPTLPNIYIGFYDSVSTDGYACAVDSQLNKTLNPVKIISAVASVLNITATAQSSLMSVFWEVQNGYSYDAAIKTNFINARTITSAGVLTAVITVIRSVGLASHAFLFNNKSYFLAIYNSTYQPTYFLIQANATTSYGGYVVSKLAYSNGGRYYITGLPSMVVTGNVAQVAYLFQDLIQATNKVQGATSSSPVYTQTGVNMASFRLSENVLSTAEIGNTLNLSGGFLWMYDGYLPVENNFHLWPDSVEVTTATTGGHLTAQIYYYVATYEWSDNQGNIYRSAPSIPVIKDISGSGTSTNTNTINVPTIRLTAKIANPPKIVLYRWSTAQQTYFQVTSLTVPTLNDPTADSVAIVDTLADTSIVGNSILYTTGGVVENIGPPATSNVTLYKSRLFLIDAEDRNLLWYSKQVIENTPVEMSDLFTIYVAPTIGAQGNTGFLEAFSAMDDKLILFKQDAIYYLIGQGPDNTGANNDFSDPVFITSTVGCANQNSIVFIPQGLLFQSDKGIWLLGRDLSTSYIGAPVEAFNGDLVVSAISIPGTNQVRFTLSSGTTLMYDYFYNQWGTFSNIPALSSTLFQSLHTYIDQYGRVFQETPNLYLDGGKPVLLSFTSSWINLATVQGFERAYDFFLLATYLSPHKINLQIAYDYNPSPTQSTTISPTNFSAVYGGDTLWGSTPTWGGQSNIEQWRIFLNRQKCEAFQIILNELYDSTYGVAAGAGFTLSGLDLTIGVKSQSPRLRRGANNQIG